MFRNIRNKPLKWEKYLYCFGYLTSRSILLLGETSKTFLHSRLSRQCSGSYAFTGPVAHLPFTTRPHSLHTGMGESMVTW